MANVVEIRGRLTGTEFFDFAHVTPATPGMNAVVTSFVDANGLVPGMVGYVGPTVQAFQNEVVTIIDNETFDDTVEGADIDFSKHQHAILANTAWVNRIGWMDTCNHSGCGRHAIPGCVLAEGRTWKKVRGCQDDE